MSDEIGTSSPLGQLRPLDHAKDTGQRPSEQEVLLQKRKRRPQEAPPDEDEPKGEPTEGVKASSAGKIVDIVI